MRILLGLIVAWAVVANGDAAHAQTKPAITTLGPERPQSALFIGNSFFFYNNDLPEFVSALQRSVAPEGPFLRTTLVAISGSGLDWHDVASYFRPNGIGKYSFDGQNHVTFNTFDRPFDVAVMMDCSQCPIHPDLKAAFFEYAGKDADIVRAKGAHPAFFMSWAYEDRPEMTDQLAEAYTIAGNQNRALVIPAGLAFARARLQRPDLNLYAPDRRHPSLAGTYLAACATFAALMDRSPVGMSFHAGLNAETAEALQRIAWETTQDYYGRNKSPR